MLINDTYFTGKIVLPVSDIQNELNGYILRLEPEILTKVLGYDLKKAFLDGLEDDPILQKWTDLLEGKEYQVNGIYYNWRGFTNDLKESIISNYVFCYYLQHGSKFNSQFGLRQVNTENSQPADIRFKYTMIYNEMIDWIAELDQFIVAMNGTGDIYPNYAPELIRKINPFGA